MEKLYSINSSLVYIKRKRGDLSATPVSNVLPFYIRLDCCQSVDVNLTEEFWTYDLLSVAGHYASTWCEVIWIVDQWSHDKWDIWCVYCAGF